MDIQEQNKFKEYTDEKLNHFVWLWNNCSATRILNDENTYQQAVKEVNKRHK